MWHSMVSGMASAEVASQFALREYSSDELVPVVALGELSGEGLQYIAIVTIWG